jgi:hypothetical protein
MPAFADNSIVERDGIITVSISENIEKDDNGDKCISSDIIGSNPSKKPLWFDNIEKGIFFWEDDKNYYFAASYNDKDIKKAKTGALVMGMYELYRHMDDFLLTNIKASISGISNEEAKRLQQQNVLGVSGDVKIENGKIEGTVIYNASRNICGEHLKDSFVEIIQEKFLSGKVKTEYCAWALVTVSKYNYNRAVYWILGNIENQIIFGIQGNLLD